MGSLDASCPDGLAQECGSSFSVAAMGKMGREKQRNRAEPYGGNPIRKDRMAGAAKYTKPKTNLSPVECRVSIGITVNRGLSTTEICIATESLVDMKQLYTCTRQMHRQSNDSIMIINECRSHCT